MDFALTWFVFLSIRFEFSRESKACYKTSQSIIFCQPWLSGYFFSLTQTWSTSPYFNQLKTTKAIWECSPQIYADATRFMRIWKYPFSLVGNMDQTPAFFWHAPVKMYCAERWRKCGWLFRRWKQTSNGCIVSHGRWTNAFIQNLEAMLDKVCFKCSQKFPGSQQ